jgi:hypothetical protein
VVLELLKCFREFARKYIMADYFTCQFEEMTHAHTAFFGKLKA